MSITRQEILSQYDALNLTLDEFLRRKEDILRFFNQRKASCILFLGCGSSYSLAKSAAITARLAMGIPAYALSAGDLFLDMKRYHPILTGAVFVTLSRSGNTSEVLYAVEGAQSQFDLRCISICEQADSGIAKLADLNLELPWAFDESVCQTRSVTNLYLACLLLVALISGKESLAESAAAMVQKGPEYIRETYRLLEAVDTGNWSKVVVLADGELEGVAEEGALAFKEICLIPSNYYHVLDVRHGPIVLIDQQTLVIAALTPGETQYQGALIKDLEATGATVLLFCDDSHESIVCKHEVKAPAAGDYASYGIPFIFVCQMLACFKAEADGINPDLPSGLDPFIVL